MEILRLGSAINSEKEDYANMPMQYTFWVVKKSKISSDFFYIFLIFAQDIDCGYTLEPPWRGASNEYSQSMF